MIKGERWLIVFICILASMILYGSGFPWRANAADQAEINTAYIGRYRLEASGDYLYKIDTVTGRTWRSVVLMNFGGSSMTKFEEIK